MIATSAQVFFTVESGLLLLALAILVGPALAERMRIPGLIGLIFVGTVFGPFVLQWMRPEGLVATVGAAGLLYLMFLAGVELDLPTFKANQKAAISFGLLTFAIPFGLSFLVGTIWLGYSVVGASLVGAMWASHTIVAYPEVKAAGLDRNPAVGSAVAATVITDILALIVLAVAASSTSLQSTPSTRASVEEAPLPLWLGLILLLGFTMWALPRAVSWIFARSGQTREKRFIVVLAAMSAGAVVSLLGGIEGLVGAFLAGIGINRLIPAKGELMERIEFFGSSLFVPAFLISVGLSIDPLSLIEGSTVQLALTFTLLVIVGKSAAAAISGKLFGLDKSEIGVLASLTIGQAAATLAIAQVGVATGIFDQEILNAAVLTVVLTVLVTSFGTRYFASRVTAPQGESPSLGSHVLVQTSVGDDAKNVIGLAAAIAAPDGGLVSPVVISNQVSLPDVRQHIEQTVRTAMSFGLDTEAIVRSGTRLGIEARDIAIESAASLILVPWSGPSLRTAMFGRPDASIIGVESPVPVAAVAVQDEEFSRVVLFTGRYSGNPKPTDDLRIALRMAQTIAGDLKVPLIIYNSEDSDDSQLSIDKVEVRQIQADTDLAGVLSVTDLVILPAHAGRQVMGIGMRRLGAVSEQTSVIVVAGPGRLNLGGGSRRSSTHGMTSRRDLSR